MKNELVVLKAADYGLEETKAQEIQATFMPMLEKMTELEKEYNLIIQKDINEELCTEAKTLRLKYVKVRTGTADIHRKLKDFYLKGGRFVDGWKNAQIMASEGMESRLKEIENHYENIEKERITKLQEMRTEKLHKYEPDMNVPNLGEMKEDVWNNYIGGVKMQLNARIRAEKKAEKDRIKKEQAEIAERTRIREENAKLKIEAEKREKQARIEADERAKEEALRIVKQQEEQLARERAEKLRFDAEKIEREKQENAHRIERENHAMQLNSERIEKERLQKIADDRNAKIKADIKAQEEEERQAALAPDKEKLLSLAKNIENIQLPQVGSDEASDIMHEALGGLANIAEGIRESCENL